MMSDEHSLKTGSKLLIATSEDENAIGHFKGYTMIGSESALVIEMDGGRVRYIPVSQISYMDLLESVEEKPSVKERPEHLYG